MQLIIAAGRHQATTSYIQTKNTLCDDRKLIREKKRER